MAPDTHAVTDWLVHLDAAEYLGMSDRTLRRLGNAGYLPFYKPTSDPSRPGRSASPRRYRREDLDAYILAHTHNLEGRAS